MNLSFWEQKTGFSKIDFTIVGSGIVGLHAALKLREKYPKSKIVILEKGYFPEGGSTKNAGFACIGSISELLSDLKIHSEKEVVDLVDKRKRGLELLRRNLGDQHIDYKHFGGFELFLPTQKALFENCESRLDYINQMLRPILKKNTFQIVSTKNQFQNVEKFAFFNFYEGQIDTGKMMQTLLKKVFSLDIRIYNLCEVLNYEEQQNYVTIQIPNFNFQTKHLFIANNGYASKLTGQSVQPARAQVLITKPIKNLKIKGTFHLDEGYYYFRNFKNRILLGGGRNLDFEGETTTNLQTTEQIQNALEKLLSEVILPNQTFEIDQRWSGIMGVGPQKMPIVKSLSSRVHCGIRMGGMGVAIGSLIGQELADLIK